MVKAGIAAAYCPCRSASLGLQHDVNEPMTLGLDHRIDVFDPVGTQHGVVEPADLAVPRLGNLAEEVLILGNREDSRRDSGDRSELGTKRIDVLQGGLDVGET